MKSKKWSAVTLLAGLFSVVGCGVFPPSPEACRASKVAILDDGPRRMRDFRGIYRTSDDISLQISETTYTLCQGLITKNKHGYNVADRVCEHGDVVWTSQRGSGNTTSAYLVGFGKTKIGAAMYGRFTWDIPQWNSSRIRPDDVGDEIGDWDYPFNVNGDQPLCNRLTCSTFGPMHGQMFIWHKQDLECLGEWVDVLLEQEE